MSQAVDPAEPLTQALKKPLTPWQRLWKDAWARTAFVVLCFLYFSAAFADFLTPYGMNFNDPELANAPPTRVHFYDFDNRLCWPYVFPVTRVFDPVTLEQNFEEDVLNPAPIKLFAPGPEYKLFGLIPGNIHLFEAASPEFDPSAPKLRQVEGSTDEAHPARLFLLGSDINGRDNFSRLFFGAQKSLTIGFLGLFISFPIGIIYGALAGYFGGVVDNIMMRLAEAVMSIPSFYLLIGLAAILPAGMSSTERFALITVILSFIGWASLARVIRGMVLSIRQEEFVQAAIAAGMSEFKTIVKHVVPQTVSFVIVAATLQVPNFILSESGLSFIGLGIQQPDASWGNMLKAALDNVNDLVNQPWMIAPGIAIFVTILCFNTVGDVLRDVLDPKLRGSV